MDLFIKIKNRELALPLPEQLRREYLQALGIDSYFPRLRLPGAPESKQCNWSSTAASTNLSTNPLTTEESFDDQVVSAEPEISVPVIKKVIDVESPPTPVAVSNTISPEEENTQNSTSDPSPVEEIRLQLHCIRVNAKLVIINALPHLATGQLSAHHKNLLNNLFNSAGIVSDEMHVEDKPFRWPMVQGVHVDNSKPAAAAALLAYLEQKLSDWQFSQLLVMGDQVITSLFSVDSAEDVKVAALDDQSWQTFYTRSLDEILHSPLLKKDVWAVIQKLQA